VYGQVWFEDSYCSNYLKYSGRSYDKLAATLASEYAINARVNRRTSKHGTKRFGESFDGKWLPKDLVNLIEASKAEGMEPQLLHGARQTNDVLGRSK